MPPLDHVDVPLDQTGTELIVFHVLEEDNGIQLQDNVFVPVETGMDFHVSHVPLDKHGTLILFLVHVPLDQTGMDLNVKLVQEIDFGVTLSMTVFVKEETGMELNVFNVHKTLIGMVWHVFLVLDKEHGIVLILLVNVPWELNGTV